MNPAPEADRPERPGPVLARVHRDAVSTMDGQVLGYTVTLSLDMAPGIPQQTPAPTAEPPTGAVAPTSALAALLHEQYLALDLENLVADRFAFIPAGPEMLDGFVPCPVTPARLVLDLPAGFEHRDDAVRRATALRGLGVSLCLPAYRGEVAQEALLPLLAFVTLDPAAVTDPGPRQRLADLVAAAHALGVSVLTDIADPGAVARCRTAGVDAVRGAGVPAAGHRQSAVLRAGQLQCLAVMHLLNEPERDLGKVAEVIDTDPVLTLRVLHLVNSGAFGLRREIDTVQQAVVLLGPRELTTLVAALALDARPDAMDSLWLILARALSCEQLADDPAGYTVGLLSALIDELGVPADVVLEKVGVSPVVAGAVRDQSGELGRVLAAVLAHEARDYARVLAMGMAPLRVSDVHVRSLASALATARAVSPA